MADIYLRDDAFNLLRNKNIIFIGSSNMRAQYKDLLWLLTSNSLIPQNCLKAKLEPSFAGDSLISRSKLTKSRLFEETRIYEKNQMRIEFMFITRCINERLLDLLDSIKNNRRRVPDAIIINSALWDISRWGPNGPAEYKKNMVTLMDRCKESLPRSTLLIWTTELATNSRILGGLIVKQIEFVEASMRFHILEANEFSAKLVASYGFDVIDFHYYIHLQVSRRSSDGVHYLPLPVRFLSNILLTHLGLTWGVSLPNRCSSEMLSEEIFLSNLRRLPAQSLQPLIPHQNGHTRKRKTLSEVPNQFSTVTDHHLHTKWRKVEPAQQLQWDQSYVGDVARGSYLINSEGIFTTDVHSSPAPSTPRATSKSARRRRNKRIVNARDYGSPNVNNQNGRVDPFSRLGYYQYPPTTSRNQYSPSLDLDCFIRFWEFAKSSNF